MGIKEDASSLHSKGCNCAQCVLGACGKYGGLDTETALAIASGFGGGVRSGEICGAISGAVMAIGLLEKDKKNTAVLTRQCVEKFLQTYGCVRCQDLKRAGVSCRELIENAAQFVDDTLIQNNNNP